MRVLCIDAAGAPSAPFFKLVEGEVYEPLPIPLDLRMQVEQLGEDMDDYYLPYLYSDNAAIYQKRRFIPLADDTEEESIIEQHECTVISA